jgi:hypothetical protein
MSSELGRWGWSPSTGETGERTAHIRAATREAWLGLEQPAYPEPKS